jgi:hypothetical protein
MLFLPFTATGTIAGVVLPGQGKLAGSTIEYYAFGLWNIIVKQKNITLPELDPVKITS